MRPLGATAVLACCCFLGMCAGSADAQQGAVDSFQLWDAENDVVIDTNLQDSDVVDLRIVGDCVAIEAMPNAYLAIPNAPGSIAFAIDGAPIDCSPGAGTAYENNVPYFWEEHVAASDPLCADSLRVHGSHTMTVVPYDENDCLGAEGAPLSVTFEVIALDNGRCAPAICGDGILQDGEACDDGNETVGDGCDAMGQIEDGFACYGVPSTCCIQVYTERDRAFYRCTSPATPENAAMLCEFAGGGLARATSQTITDGITSEISGLWIDGTDAVTEGTWLYGDGSPVGFFNWQAGEPDGATDENCVHIVSTGEWADLRCDATLPFVCEAPWPDTCGDSVVDAGEECDDGNENEEDGCTSDCELTTCGNGVVELGEGCDDGNASNTDGCLASCAPAMCGDGFVWEGQEECDDGNAIDTDACTNACTRRTADGTPRSGGDDLSGGCTVMRGGAPVLGAWAIMAMLLATRRRKARALRAPGSATARASFASASRD